jgi:hypothetical protein
MTPPVKSTQDALRKLSGDLPWFASNLLRVRTKGGADTELHFNRAQRFLHERIEQQRQRDKNKKVRALVLKGRQQGVSTYMQARYFWRIWSGFGQHAYILTHRHDASQNLFDMARRFLDRLPAAFTPIIGVSNHKELQFKVWESGYQVATAGARATGRSATAQLIHGSEVAYWPSAEEHMAGLGQAVGPGPETEIVLESTANGVGNLFHRLWQSAERGDSDYTAIFIPWFWQEEYARPIPSDFVPDTDEAAYRQRYTLTPEQIYWRRMKIRDDFAGDPIRFQVEYPATAAEAFAVAGQDSFIPSDLILRADCRTMRGSGPVIVGVDPARFGPDSTAIVRRRGREVLRIERMRDSDTMQVVGKIIVILRDECPERVFIDSGGLGAGVYDRLAELGCSDRVFAVQFGEKALQPDRYVNRRAEMWDAVKQWLRLGGVNLGKDSILAGELPGPQYSYDSLGRVKLEAKEDMRARGIASPDAADALALTFAWPPGNGPSESAWEGVKASFESASGHDPSDYLPGIHTG